MYAYAAPRPPRTPDGLRWILVAFVMYMVTLGLQLALSVAAASALAGLQGGAPPGGILGALSGLIAIAVLTVALSLLVLVFYFLGFGHLYAGRYEFAPPHPRNVQVSLYTLIATVVLVPLGVMVQIALVFSAAFAEGPFGRPDPGSVFATVNTAIGVGIAFSVAASALASVTLVLSVRALVRPEHQYLLLAAGVLGPITPTVTGALTLWQFSTLFAGPGGALMSDFGIGIPTAIASGLGLATFGLYLVVYRDARERIRVGELQPIVPAPGPLAWLPMPVTPPPFAPPPMSPPGPERPSP